MKVAQIWRYPVKSMAGEQLDHARIGSLGIEGDRVVHVENENGHVITSRTHHRLLGHHARLNESGEPVVDGLLWGDPKVRTGVEDIVGPGAKLVRDDSSDRFDVLPLLVATDGAMQHSGVTAGASDRIWSSARSMAWPSAHGQANACTSETSLSGYRTSVGAAS